MNEIVVIGKVIDRSGDYLHVSYPSVAGVRDARIPVENIEREERLTGNRVAILVSGGNGYDTNLHFSGRNAPYNVTPDFIRIACAMENGEELSEEDYDDEVPHIDVADAPPVVLLGNHDDDTPEAQEHEVWGQGMFSGGRRGSECDWRFIPTRKPAFVFMDDDSGMMAPTAARVNDIKGGAAAYHIFNPNYADNRRPMGAYLGTFGENYYPMPYEKGFAPILTKADEFGWKASVTAFTEGKQARLDCDVSQAAHTESELKDRLRGISTAFDESITTPIGGSLSGLYRYGFTIYNSLDGSSAFRGQATAMRHECANMMMLDSAKQNLFSLKHTKGQMEAYNYDDLADKINDIILAAQQELVNVELLKSITCSRDLLERIMTLSEKRGLITKPTIKRNDVGDVTSIDRGYMWKLLGHGMTHPEESWVAVDKEDKGSLFQVYNVLTGAITHKPLYKEAAKAPLKGSTLTFRTMDDRLKKTHDLLMSTATTAVKDYNKEAGSDPISDINDLRDFTASHEILEDVPLFSEVLY